ncbi:MAG: hypothetical protein WBL50_00590 [Candidatus Acidiferrum sp.]
MRKLLLLCSLSFGLAFSLAAGQHAAVSVAAPAVVVRAMPSGQVSAAHALPAHPPTHAHSGSNVGAPVHTSTVGSHRSGNPPLPVHTIPPAPLGGSVNPITAGPSFCNRRGSGLVGLNACPPTTGVVLPFFGGSVYLPIPYYADAGAATDQEQPQEEASNQPPPDSNPQSYDQDPSVGGPALSRYRSSSNDFTKSLSEFVFVERDGTKIYAVAYSFLNDKLQYVTKEGVRRTVALDSLDLDATQKQNEDLGNTINLPTPVASGVAFNLPVAPLQ